jgi:ankyrin repeat protein
MTPLHSATINECKKCIYMLVNHGASLKVRDSNNYTPLHYGILYGHGAGLDAILDLGGDPEEEW